MTCLPAPGGSRPQPFLPLSLPHSPSLPGSDSGRSLPSDRLWALPLTHDLHCCSQCTTSSLQPDNVSTEGRGGCSHPHSSTHLQGLRHCYLSTPAPHSWGHICRELGQQVTRCQMVIFPLSNHYFSCPHDDPEEVTQHLRLNFLILKRQLQSCFQG